MPSSNEKGRPRWVYAVWVDWAPLLVLLVGYGLFRAGVVVSVLAHGRLPGSTLGWSGMASGLAAAGQAIAVAVLLVVVRWRQPVAAGLIALVGVGTAVVDAALWVVLGSAAAPAGYAWQVVLAVVFAVAAMVVCRSGLQWIRRSTGGYDLPRITGALRRSVGAAIVVSAGAGAALLMDWPAVVDRLLHLVAIAGVAGAIDATIVWLLVLDERRREQHDAARAELYRRLNQGYSADDL